MTYELDSGKRFGLPPIGLPESNLSTSASDTERRAMPGLATKNSVFAWRPPDSGAATLGILLDRPSVTGFNTEVVNVRKNAATGGLSFDVPTWAAGCVISVASKPIAKGTSNYFAFGATCPSVTGSTVLSYNTTTVVPAGGIGEVRQIVVPFFDEPVFSLTCDTDGTGTASWLAYLTGFIRNV